MKEIEKNIRKVEKITGIKIKHLKSPLYEDWVLDIIEFDMLLLKKYKDYTHGNLRKFIKEKFGKEYLNLIVKLARLEQEE